MPAGLTFTGITHDEIEAAWPLVEPLLARAAAWAGETTDRVRLALIVQDANLVVAVDDGQIVAACVTEIVITSRGEKRCNVWMVAGERLADWVEAIHQVEEWAKGLGCTSVRIDEGRNGWKRVLKPHGYRVRAVVMEKRI